MLLFSSIVLSFFLALRLILLGLIRKNLSWKTKISSLAYLALGSILFLSSEKAFPLSKSLWISSSFFVLFAIEFVLQLNKKKPAKVFSIYKLCFLFFFLVLCLFEIAISSLPHFHEDTPIAKITFTGTVKNETVEWKNPSSSLMKENFCAYEVKIETPHGKIISHSFIYGELVGVRAKIIRMHPWLTFLGVPSLYKIDSLFNDYLSIEKKQTYPYQVFPLSTKTSFWSLFWQNRLWSLWEKVFFQKTICSFLKSASLEANYFPLIDPQGNPMKGTYYLTVTAGGLSSLSKVD